MTLSTSRLIGFSVGCVLLAACASTPEAPKASRPDVAAPTVISTSTNDHTDTLYGKIVFLRRENGPAGSFVLYRIDLPARTETRLFGSRDPANGNALDPQWVEGGRRIQFSAMNEGRWMRATIDQGGDDLQWIPHTEGRTASPPVGSHAPDIEVSPPHLLVDHHVIFRCEEFLTDVKACPQNAAWSPDKKWIVFEAGPELWIVDRNGETKIKVGVGSAPDWSS